MVKQRARFAVPTLRSGGVITNDFCTSACRHGLCGYRASESFLNKCHLCFDIRKHLAGMPGASWEDLHPAPFYGQVSS